MNIYTYVAHSNPHAAKAICHKFGYRVANVKSKDDLAECLRSLVAEEGESALNEVIDNHPDKEIILERFANTKQDSFMGLDGLKTQQQPSGCGCGCSGKGDCKGREKFMEADASSQTKLVSQTNVIIIAAALLLSVAIISKQ